MGLPSAFCWTKFGAEAGEPIEYILRRKEDERAGGDGLFLWGIGTSIRPSLLALLDRTPEPDVVFTPMVSPPTPRDVSPARVMTWRAGRALDGRPFTLPAHVRVTSGAPPQGRARHYALVCNAAAPLALTAGGRFFASSVRNLRTGAPVGSSQVTAVVERHDGRGQSGLSYKIAFQAKLVHPYLVTLIEPADASHDHPDELTLTSDVRRVREAVHAPTGETVHRAFGGNTAGGSSALRSAP